MPLPIVCCWPRFRRQRLSVRLTEAQLYRSIMTKTLKCCRGLMMLGISLLFFTCQSWAASGTLESSVLRLEITTRPYSYRVIEKSTGEVLLSQDNTALTFGEEAYPVADASNVVEDSSGIHGTLIVETAGREKLPGGAPDRGQVTFTFLRPEVLQVQITYNSASPSEVSEQFNDQGEHYYGIWEYPFGGHIDDRGADADFLTSKKYGIYVESLAQGHFAVAQAGKTNFTFKDSQLKYDIIYGPSYADVLNRYNAMAGPAFMPPAWAFSSIWWRDDEHDDLRDVRNAQEKVIDDADRLRKLHIPAGASEANGSFHRSREPVDKGCGRPVRLSLEGRGRDHSRSYQSENKEKQ